MSDTPLHYREIFDGVQDIIYVRDMSGVILEINDAGARFFGMSKDQLIGRTLHRQIDDQQAQSLDATNAVLIQQGVDRSTVELREANGKTRILEATTTLIRDDQRLPIGAYGVMRDVTEAIELRKMLEAENARKSEELEEARLVQQSLLPKQPPSLSKIDIAVKMISATEVGGDYYDFSAGDDGSLTIAVGDATGHGLKSAILAATAKSYFQTLAKRCSQREVLTGISDALSNLGIPSVYLCLMLVRIQQREAAVVGAGMPPFFLRHTSGRIERIEVAGTPLGLRGKPKFDGAVLPFDRGTTMLIFSDGLPDLLDADDRELGYERIESSFGAAGEKAEDVLTNAIALVGDWSKGRPIADDVTIVALRAT
jgi:PAS domain S-box-containing protein